MHILLYSIYVFSLIVSRSSGELFTALVDLSKVHQAEKEIGDLLQQYVSEEEERLQKLEKFAQELKEYTIKVDTDNNSNYGEELEKYFSNPVNTYLFSRKFAVEWKDKLDLLRKYIDKTFISELQEKVQSLADQLPNEEDFKGAADALIRLQETYRLSANDLAEGRILWMNSSRKLTADDCFTIGLRAYTDNNLPIASKWLVEALRLLDENRIDDESTLTKENVLDYLSYSVGKLGRYKLALKYTNKLLETASDEIMGRILENKKFFLEQLSADTTDASDEGVEFGDHYDGNIYAALCRGESPIVFPQNINNLKCFNKVTHPFFTIQPIKWEVVFDRPRLNFLHHVISDKEIEHIKTIATPHLNRATVRNPVTGVLEFATYRISKSAWLSNSFDDITIRINNRIIKMTELSIDSAEDLQVVNYGIGGHYSPHFDHGRTRPQDAFEIERGNRIATLLFYMSDVEAGGATVFTDVGAKLWPKKGAAAFWFNLKRNGDSDDLTRHAACPVLVGSKWVMNKWFHERGQEFRRPCLLNDE